FAAIAGATSLSYVITSADIGAQLEIVATSADTDGTGRTTTSAATATVTPVTPVTPITPNPPLPNTRDIFWHDASGANLAWALNQSEQIISRLMLPTTRPSWSVAAVGDFNNDGISDLLWRDASGANQIWNMDSTEQIGNGANLPTVPKSWS